MRRSGQHTGLAGLLSLSLASGAKAATTVPFEAGVGPGTIIIRARERRLYYVVGERSAVRYPVAVGRAGKQWAGQVHVNGKFVRPLVAAMGGQARQPSAA